VNDIMRKYFLIDEQSVTQSRDVTFHLNPATKHPQNPVLPAGGPNEWDSLQTCWPGTVLYDEEDGIFRCWYSGLGAVQAERNSNMPWQPGYAESKDGIHWTKPALGFHTYRSQPTNILGRDWNGYAMSFVMRNPNPQDTRRRFLSFWKDEATFAERHAPRTLASSADGKFWRREKVAYREPPPRHQMQDFSQVLYEPDASDESSRYLAYSQYWDKRSWDERIVRQIGHHHGPALDQLVDADPPIILAPEVGIDEELHFGSVYRSGQNYFMLFESDRFSEKPMSGDLRLAVSANGHDFRRVHKHKPVVALGAKNEWDSRLLVTTTSAIQVVGDEIWIYYFGNSWPGNWPPGYVHSEPRASLIYPAHLGVAILPRDRFAYAAGPGVLTVESLTLTAEPGIPGDVCRDVWVNADGNGLIIEAVGAAGEVVARGDLSDQRRETVYRKVAWNNSLTNAFQLRIALQAGAKLYSIGYSVAEVAA
jgi:hypothetical protein